MVAGQPLAGYASVTVSNLGNVALPTGQQINIQLVAHDTTNSDNADIVLASLNNQSVSGWQPGASTMFYLYVNRPAGLPADSYQIEAVITPVQALTEARTDNNLVLQAAAGAIKTITAVPAFRDLSGTFGTYWTLPSAMVAGQPLTGYASVTVKSLGNVPLPTGQQINIQLVAHDTTNADNADIVLASLSNQSVSGWQPGMSSMFYLYVNQPNGLPADSYQIEAVITPVQALAESNADNNLVVQASPGATRMITSVPAFRDLSGALGTYWSLPSAVVAGQSLAGYTSVTVKNQGNVALPTGQQINIQLVAHDTTNPGNPDIVLGSLNNQSVSAMRPGASTMYYLYVNAPAGLPADSYQIEFVITPVQALTESQTDNNLAMLTATGATKTITSVPAFMDLSSVLGSYWSLPSAMVAGTALSGYASVTVSNLGNVPLPTGQQINIQLVAHDTTNSGNADIVLATLSNQSVSAMRPGASTMYYLYVNAPAGVPADSYQIEAVITPVLALTESRTDNNLATLTATGAAKTLSAVPAFVDLAAKLGTTWTLPTTVMAGTALTGYASVAVSNLGNVALPSAQQINIQFLAHDTTHPGNPDVVLATLNNQSVAGLRAGASVSFNAYVNAPVGLPADSYQVEALITPVLDLAETRTDNNLATLTAAGAAKTITANPSFVDLSGVLGTTWTLPTSVVACAPMTGTVSVVVKNLGNVALSSAQRINIQFIAHDTTDSGNADVVLASLTNQSVASLAAGGSATFTASVSNPAGLPADSYQIEALITPVGSLTEARTDNNLATVTALGATKVMTSTGTVGPAAQVKTQVVTTGQTSALTVSGTNAADTISISQNGTVSVTVTTQQGSMTYTGNFTTLAIYGFGGDDTITVTSTVAANAAIYTGEGTDTVYDLGRGIDTTTAGSGDDTLISFGGGSRHTVIGGTGLDSFWVDAQTTLTNVTSAETAAASVHQVSQFYENVSMTISGQNLTDPALGNYASRYANFASYPVFKNGPDYNDIRQGSLGDCYFVATLASIADTDPTAIRQAITSLGDGTYAVRFYRNGSPVYLRIDADLPVTSGGAVVYARMSSTGESWVPLMEKAYAFFRYSSDSYGSIEGGWMADVDTQVTNGRTQALYTSSNPTAQAMYTFISSALAADNGVTLGSKSTASGPIVGNHAYMVKSATTVSGVMYVTVYNPWGYDGGSSTDSNANDGLITLTIGQVQSLFSAAVAMV
jgi:hypothetical protein